MLSVLLIIEHIVYKICGVTPIKWGYTLFYTLRLQTLLITLLYFFHKFSAYSGTVPFRIRCHTDGSDR